MIQCQKFVANMVKVNSYLLWDETKVACIIDPGFLSAEEKESFRTFLEDNGLQLEKSIATHMHFDHVLGARFVEDIYGVKTEVPKGEISMLPPINQQLVTLGIGVQQGSFDFSAMPLSSEVYFGNTTLKVLKTPGHSPAHVTFYSEEGGAIFCGDVLFKNGYGRYDLWGGDYATLMNSIDMLLELPDETIVLPGHGSETTIRAERINFF